MLVLVPTLALADVPERFQALDDALSELEARGVAVGEVVAAEAGTIVYRRQLGGVPEGARYRIGSISKSLTAAAVLTLVDDDVLTLADPVAQWLPDVGELGTDGVITLSHLLHHTSGLGPAMVGPFARAPSFAEWHTAVDATEQLRTSTPPGQAFAYSNGGYILLTEVVTRASGMTYADFVDERILEPLSMAETAIAPTPEQLAREVPGHVHAGFLGLVESRRALPHWTPNDYRWPIGGDGAWSSTTDDLVRWAEGLRTGRLLTDEARGDLLTPHLDDYACGWMVDDNVWHNGALSPLGHYGYLRWQPGSPDVVAALIAVDMTSMSAELRVAMDAALDGEEPPDIRPVTSFAGSLALLSTLYTPWWLGLAPIVGLLQWGRRPGRTRTALAAAGLGTLGIATVPLATTGLRGVVLGALATMTVVRLAWSRASPVRPARHLLMIIAGAMILAAAVNWSLLVLGLYALIDEPWGILASLGG